MLEIKIFFILLGNLTQIALKNILNGSINITEALNQASQDVPPNIMLQTRTDVFGSKKREQLMNFIKNYKEQNKLSLQEYVDKNKSKFKKINPPTGNRPQADPEI